RISPSLIPRLGHFFSFFFSVIPRPFRSTLFPYTTLFRSQRFFANLKGSKQTGKDLFSIAIPNTGSKLISAITNFLIYFQSLEWRSEEHTSELQSRFDLVCRLLLEKKILHDIFFLCSYFSY